MKPITTNQQASTNQKMTCLSNLTQNERRILLYIQFAFIEACRLSGKTSPETIALWNDSNACKRYNDEIAKAGA
jgi:5-keto 4-deoxyuronate isomerase